MNDKPLPQWRVYFTALVLLAQLAHLAWEHFHGGVRSHHILNRADLPAISNAWGVLMLPAMAWFLIGRAHRRVNSQSHAAPPTPVVATFIGALLFGALFAGSFAYGYETVTGYLFQGLIVLALLLPFYRAECVLGFVLGMTFTFGAVLPTLVGSAIAALSAVARLVVYPLLVRGWTGLRRR